MPKAKNNRVPFNCLVKPETLPLLKSLAEHLDRSQGETIDRAVQALAVAESFGGEHLRLSAGGVFEPTTEPCKISERFTRPPVRMRKPLLKPKDRK